MGYCNFNLSEVGRKFHDEEWGVPVHDDRRLFEFLVLAAMQCGFTWEMDAVRIHVGNDPAQARGVPPGL